MAPSGLRAQIATDMENCMPMEVMDTSMQDRVEEGVQGAESLYNASTWPSIMSL